MAARAEAALLPLAARQHGVFTLAQAVACGVSESTVRRRVRNGLWIELFVAVFTTTATVKTWRRQLMAAQLAFGPDAAASHRSAAAVSGFVDDAPLTPEISVPYGRRTTQRGVILHRTRHIEGVNRQGFRVTPPMRTLLDLAAVLPTGLLERALDNAHRRGLIELRRFLAYLELEHHLSRPGSGELRRMVKDRVPHAAIASELETQFFATLRRVRFPLPVPQHRVVAPSGRRCYIDFAFPDRGIAIELDSYSEHGGPAPITSDRIRRNEVEAMRLHFFHFTWEMVTSDSIAWLIPLADALEIEPSRWGDKRGTKRFTAKAKNPTSSVS